MVSGPGGRDHDSQNQLFLIWEAPRYFKNVEKIPNSFKIYYVGKSENLETCKP